ncbi:MAG: GAF domain-containing protein [Anaerolineales bacterium]|nr:GAF domain-containing protein [Anaerolineales bacterium]
MEQSLRFLLVEDNPKDADLLARELRRAGLAFTWERVQTEAEFLAALVPPPDLILADVTLPGFSGLRALELAQAAAPDTPVILISAVAGDELAVSALQQGVADYLLKDRLGRLGLAVANALRRAQRNTQKLAAEQALAEREARFRALIENSQVGIGLFDADLNLLYASPIYADTLGYTPAEYQALGALGLVHPDDLPELAAERQRLLADPAYVLRRAFRFRRADGRWLWLDCCAHNRLGEPGVRGLVISYRDITEQRAAEAALRRQAAEFEALYEIARDVAVAHDLPALLDTLAGRALRMLGAPVAGIYLYDADHGDLELTITHGLIMPPGARLKLGEGLAGQVATTRRAFSVPDYSAWNGHSSQYHGQPLAAVLGVPMLYQGELIGVVVVDELHPSTRVFSAQDERLLTLFAGLAAGAVRTARLLAAQRQRLLEQQALNRLSIALRAGQSLEEMLPRVLDETLAIMGAADGAVAVLEDGRLRLAVKRGAFEALEDAMRIGRGISDLVVETGRPYVSRDFTDDPHLRASVRPLVDPGWGGAVVPIHGSAAVSGVIYVGVPLPREILPSELRLLTTVAEMAGSAVQRMQVLAQAQERAEQLAAVNVLGRALAETHDLPQLYAQMAAATHRLLPALSALTLYLFGASPDWLECVYADRAGRPLGVSDRPSLALADPQRPPAQVIHSRQARIETGRAAPAAPAALYVPLLAKGRAIGLVLAESDQPDRFAPADAELLAGVANTAAVAIDNARLFRETNQRLQYFEALHHIDLAIAGSLDLRVTLTVLLDQLRAKLRVDAAAVLLYQPLTQLCVPAVGRGFRTRQIEQARLRLGEGPTGQAVLERRPLRLGRLNAVPPPWPRAAIVEAEGVRAYFALPLLAKGQLQGVLELYHRAPLAPDPDWLSFLDALAKQAAIAVDNATLFDDLQRSNVEMIRTYDATLEGWVNLLDQRAGRPPGATPRLADRALELARALGVPGEALGHLRRGALLHDVGLLALSDALLNKPGPLDAEEWAAVRRHPRAAYELLQPVAFLHPALDIPYAHHERWDGSGYPRQLKGDGIPLSARLFAVVDVAAALTAPRPWRAAWPLEAAHAYLAEQAGTLFDSAIVAAYLKLPPAA